MQKISDMKPSTTSGDTFTAPRINPERAREWDRYEREVAIRQRFERSGVPKRYQEANLSQCAAPVREYAERGLRDGTCLILSGSNGTGKTHQACAVANQVILDDLGSVRFATLGKILGELYDTFHVSERSESVIYRYSKCRLLVLDDLGKEHMSPTNAEKLFRIIDERWANRKPTIVTTNLASRELRGSLTTSDGDGVAKAIIDRLADKTNTFVTLGGGSLRR